MKRDEELHSAPDDRDGTPPTADTEDGRASRSAPPSNAPSSRPPSLAELAAAANLHPDLIDLAIDRTVLANERTHASWVRTGLAGMVAGLAIEKFMVELMPSWSIHLIAELLLVMSAVAFLVSAWRYTHLGVKIAPDVKRIPDRMVLTSALLLAGAALLAAVAIW